MSTQHEDSFLPSGAINTLGTYYDIPYYLSCPQTIDSNFHHHYPHITYETNSVMSPPKTRDASIEDVDISLMGDWSTFVQHLRNQFQGERAHLRADRDRMQEVIEGERELWERERQIWNKERKALRTRITDLEIKLLSVSDSNLNPGQVSSHENHKLPFTFLKNTDGSTITKIPQESGRDADGSPFYAPAPLNPTRTFDSETASNLRVDDLVVPRETAIRVTSKELTSLDFLPKMCSIHTVSEPQDVIGESIDISHIQPELDSVSIRVSAVSPTFAAKTLQPQGLLSRSNSQSKKGFCPIDKQKVRYEEKNGEENSGPAVFSPPDNNRLKLFAGHTPIRCGTNFDFPSELTTETRFQNCDIQNKVSSVFETQESDGHSPDNKDDGNEELSEPLGLVNASGQDDSFLARLTEKLAQEALKSENLESPSEFKPTQIDQEDSSSLSSSHEVEEAEGPILRMKPSLNFGRPFGLI
ncbi:hypothetical protein EV44_g5592 [Erysiphe necator]|uniref:Uncharacterized protein n=1 Tax=Uncinula necator TaxID=52586 RepID=A0A0B1P2H7_UNCNE|nr:hypothetical protein EV44_g5592 [Erysiphe necator]